MDSANFERIFITKDILTATLIEHAQKPPKYEDINAIVSYLFSDSPDRGKVEDIVKIFVKTFPNQCEHAGAFLVYVNLYISKGRSLQSEPDAIEQSISSMKHVCAEIGMYRSN